MKRSITIIIGLLILILVNFTPIAGAVSVTQENHRPVAEIVHPSHGDNVAGFVEIGVAAIDHDGNDEIASVFIKIDDGNWTRADYINEHENHTWWQIGWNTTGLENGYHHIRAKAFDGQVHSEEDVIGVDVQNGEPENHPPRVEISRPAMDETVSGRADVVVMAMDPDGNDEIEQVQMKLGEGEWLNMEFLEEDENHSWWGRSWNTVEYENGVYHLRARALDDKDHSEVDVVEVIVHNEEENHLPVAQIVEMHSGDTVTGVVNVWVRASDPDGMEDIEGVFVRIDEGDWHNATFNRNGDIASFWVYEWDTTMVENGEHHIHTIAFDGDNEGELNGIGVLVHNEVENHFPEVEIMEPGEGDGVSGSVEVLIAASDADGVEDIEMVYVRIDDGEWHEASLVRHRNEDSSWTFEWDTTTVENGEHNIHAKAFDGIDDGEGDVVGVLVHNEVVEENHPPRVEIIAPEHGDAVDGVVTIRLSATDADGIGDLVSVAVFIDDGDLNEAFMIEPGHELTIWTYEWNTTTVEDGEHNICAFAWDGKDESETFNITVIVHNEINVNHPPRVEIIDVEPNHRGVLMGDVTVHMRTSDHDGIDEVDLVQVRIDEGEWAPARLERPHGEFTFWSFAWDTTTVRDGAHVISAIAFDGEDHSEIDRAEHTVQQRNEDDPREHERHSRVDENWGDIYGTEIREGIDGGFVGAEMTITRTGGRTGSDIVTYLAGMELEMGTVSNGRMDITIRGNFSTGKVFVLNIDETVLDVSSFDDMVFKLDGEVIEVSNIHLVLSESGDEAKYCLTVGNDGLRALIYIPHFSEHVVTIESESFISVPSKTEELPEFLGIIAIAAGILVVLLLFVNVLRLGKKKHKLIRKDERIPGLSPMYNLMDKDYGAEDEPDEEWDW